MIQNSKWVKTLFSLWLMLLIDFRKVFIMILLFSGPLSLAGKTSCEGAFRRVTKFQQTC